MVWCNQNTLGLDNNNNTKEQVQYEIYPTLPQKQLTVNEKNLFDGLDIDPEDNERGVTGDVGVAFTWDEHVLKMWCEDIEQAVSEGEQYEIMPTYTYLMPRWKLKRLH